MGNVPFSRPGCLTVVKDAAKRCEAWKMIQES